MAFVAYLSITKVSSYNNISQLNFKDLVFSNLSSFGVPIAINYTL